MLEVLLYPDPRLRRVSTQVEEFDDPLRELAAEMIQTMTTESGVGLAAPQVGISIRLLVMNPSGEEGDDHALVNPRITASSGRETGEEGCLSFPGIYASLVRKTEIKIEAQDLDGQAVEWTLNGFPARVVLHELDHLDGILFVDRMTPAERIRWRPRLRELSRQASDAAQAADVPGV